MSMNASEQCMIQCPAQGHFNICTGKVKNPNHNLLTGGLLLYFVSDRQLGKLVFNNVGIL